MLQLLPANERREQVLTLMTEILGSNRMTVEALDVALFRELNIEHVPFRFAIRSDIRVVLVRNPEVFVVEKPSGEAAGFDIDNDDLVARQ